MNSLKKDITLKNIVSFLKYKTYILDLLENKISDISIKVLDENEFKESINIILHGKEYEIIIKYRKKNYVFKILMVDNIKKKNNIILENDSTFKSSDDSPVFIFPKNIVIAKKLDVHNENFIDEMLFYIHLKHSLFCTEKETTNISLITQKKKEEIKRLASSEYDSQVLYSNSINSTELIFHVFNSPPYVSMKDIAGFKYNSADKVSCYTSDYRFCKKYTVAS